MTLETSVGELRLRNPVLTASGTFGYGEEIGDLVDIAGLGGIVCKTVTRYPRAGNPPPRTCETPAGMLNAIGLQNVGLERFVREKMPYLRGCGAPVIVNVAGQTAEEFAFLCRALSEVEGVSAIELNISCPNVAHGLDFATDAALAEEVVAGARRATALPLWAKLSPNVTDIAAIARAAQNGGADALCVANTFVGLAIDIGRRRPGFPTEPAGCRGQRSSPWRCARSGIARLRFPFPLLASAAFPAPPTPSNFCWRAQPQFRLAPRLSCNPMPPCK